MRRVWSVLSVVLWGFLPAVGQDHNQGYLAPDALIRPEAALSALLGLEVDRQMVDAERDRLVDRMAAWRTDRDRVLGVIQDLYHEVDELLAAGSKDMEGLLRRVRNQEIRFQVLGEDGRGLIRRMRENVEKRAFLQAKAGELMALLPGDKESITGIWDVRLMPTGENGVFTIFQSGTLLSGEYILGGGWHGSLRGTLVEGRVYLERIDSVKGRFADLSGQLEGSGRVIRGRWKERDLTSNRPVEGSWIARKRKRPDHQAP